MKATLTFNLPEEQEEHQTALKGIDYKCAIDSIKNELFRPYRKHGYPDPEMQELAMREDVYKFMEMLENQLYVILSQYGADE